MIRRDRWVGTDFTWEVEPLFVCKPLLESFTGDKDNAREVLRGVVRWCEKVGSRREEVECPDMVEVERDFMTREGQLLCLQFIASRPIRPVPGWRLARNPK